MANAFPEPSTSQPSGSQSKPDQLADLECPVCFEGYDDKKHMPKLLSCHHTVCVSCADRMRERLITFGEARRGIQCPTCRIVTWGIRAKNLQTNFYIQQSQEIINKSIENAGCTKHGGQPLLLYCSTCNVKICQDCTVLQHDPTANHRVKEIVKKLGVQTSCQHHKGQPLSFFCATCKVMICRDCTTDDHNKTSHVIQEADDTRVHFQNMMQNQLDEIHKSEVLHSEIDDKTNEKIDEIGDYGNRLCQVIENKFKTYIGIFTTKKASLINEVERLVTEQKQALADYLEANNNGLNCLQNDKQRYRTALGTNEPTLERLIDATNNMCNKSHGPYPFPTVKVPCLQIAGNIEQNLQAASDKIGRIVTKDDTSPVVLGNSRILQGKRKADRSLTTPDANDAGPSTSVKKTFRRPSGEPSTHTPIPSMTVQAGSSSHVSSSHM